MRLYLNIARYQPIYGSFYIDLPQKIKRKQAIINVKNTDNKCFQWAILAALHPIKVHAERAGNYIKFEKELDFDGIEFPVTINKISRFEKRNNIAVSIFGLENSSCFPVYISHFEGQKHINLLFISNSDINHYCWIKNLNRQLCDQTNHHERKYFCRFCLLPKDSEKNLQEHMEECKVNVPQKVVLPDEKNNILRFTNFHKQQKVPFIIFADFEAITAKIEGPELNTDQFFTQKTQKHRPCGFCYVIVRSDGKTKDPVSFRGPNAVEEFFKRLFRKLHFHQKSHFSVS